MSTCRNGHALAREDARFCPTCGADVVPTCANGHELRAGARFCPTCGATARVSEDAPAWSPHRDEPSPTATTFFASQATTGEVPTALVNAPRRPPGGSRRNLALGVGAGGLVVLVALVLVVVNLTASHTSPTTIAATTTVATTTTGAPLVTTPVQVAQEITQLLSSGPQDRAILQGAIASVQQSIDARTGCGASVSNAVVEIQHVDANRLSQINFLSTLSLSSIPGGARALATLESAWSLSSRIDHDFGVWAMQEQTHNCSLSDSSVASYVATSSLDPISTQIKTQFVTLWNPIARSLNQPSSWTASQI